MAKLVAKTYGTALFDLSLEQNNLDEIYNQANVVLDVLSNNEEMMKILKTPQISKENKIKVIEECFKNKVNDSLVGLMVVIITKSRYNDLKDSLGYFIKKVKENKQIAVAFITSAVILNDTQKDLVEKTLLEKTKKSSIEMNFIIDKSIIGGMIIRIGDRVVDNSIKGKMNTLTNQLTKLQV